MDTAEKDVGLGHLATEDDILANEKVLAPIETVATSPVTSVRRRKPIFEDYVYFADVQRAGDKEEDGPK
jgi:hypothetical protein